MSKRHRITCEGYRLAYGEMTAVLLVCTCGKAWWRDAIDEPFATSLVACECGAKGGFDLRTNGQRAIDSGGAFVAAVKDEMVDHYARAIDAIKLETP